MGTKLECCAINPRSSRFSVHFKDDYFQTRKLKENCESMVETRVDNMESIKKTMQMHEDMFKHQVRELHRLYTVQKTLMGELKNGIKTNRLCAATSITNQTHQFINTKHFTKTQITCGYNNSHVEEADPPSSRENSGSCSNDYFRAMKMPTGLDLERPSGEDNSVQDEDSETELTLCIGGSSKKKIANNSKSMPYNQSHAEEIREDVIGLNAPLLSFPWFTHKQDLQL